MAFKNRLKTFLVKNLSISNVDAEKLIFEKRVHINGKRGRFTSSVTQSDEVKLDGKVILEKKKFIYIKYYKPVGIESTMDPAIENNITTAVGHPERLFPIGRLDKDSEGLLLLTNDGSIYNKILKSEHNKEKEYMVSVNRDITEEFITAVRSGIIIMGKRTKPAEIFVNKGNDRSFRIILTEGMNRQIRRMCHKCNYQVKKLKRIRIVNILLNDMKAGQWKDLEPVELENLFRSIGKTEEGAEKPKKAEEPNKPKRASRHRAPARQNKR
ncbi:MAG TPA: pseudouridine synthase [Bacteroidia bacterium]|jgi:23S rRNA pseudouridine2604 synthase|nr:pseudouridine synthase [Bacteroidia bacterium]